MQFSKYLIDNHNEAINCSKFFASEAFPSKSHENSSIEFWNVKVIFQKGIKNLLGFLLKLKVLNCNDHTTYIKRLCTLEINSAVLN